MNIELNKTYLLTTEEWFYAPDGKQYRAVWGTITAIETDEMTLGIKTNRGSTNWYVIIGNMIVAGCQINYAISCQDFNQSPVEREIDHEGKIHVVRNSRTHIYNANETDY
jgi:hypothetical protein